MDRQAIVRRIAHRVLDILDAAGYWEFWKGKEKTKAEGAKEERERIRIKVEELMARCYNDSDGDIGRAVFKRVLQLLKEGEQDAQK